jgi:hypothetical protein
MTTESWTAVRPDWEQAATRSRTEPWATSILDRVREDFLRWDGYLTIPGPEAQSEWSHHYFCDDGTRLRFDPMLPHTHVCPTCGRRYDGDPYDGAWRTALHNLVASHAQRAALLTRLDPDPALRDAGLVALVEIIGTYAGSYTQYPMHGVKVGKGRVMPQNLDESIWIIALLRAVRWAEPLLERRTIAQAEGLSMFAAALLEPQVSEVHNIQCWVLAALAECAVRSGDDALARRVRSGPYGIETQIREGFRAEGLWYETSTFYHFYALAALLSYREASGPEGLSPQDDAVLARAIHAPARLAYTDGLLPAYNDCWPTGHLDDCAGHVAAASAVLPGIHLDGSGYRDRGVHERPVDLWIGAGWDDGTDSRPMTGPCSIAALVFGPGPIATDPMGGDPAVPVAPATPDPRDTETTDEAGLKTNDTGSTETTDPATGAVEAGDGPLGPSFLWPDAGIGVITSDRVRVGMRFGPDVGMHDHHDKLGVDVETASGWRSLDPGSGGYTSAFTKWTQSACAHSIGIIVDRPQPPVDGELENWSPTAMSARVAWDDADLHRSIELTGDGWTDTMTLTARDTVPLMWVFHGDGEVTADPTRTSTLPTPSTVDPSSGTGQASTADQRAADDGPVGPVGRAPGGEWYRDIHQIHPGRDHTIDVAWCAPGAPHASIRVPDGVLAYTAVADGNPTGHPMGIVFIRTVAQGLTVSAHFTA